MNGYLTLALTSFTAFFAIMNPIANAPIFLGLVEGLGRDRQKRVATRGCVIAFVIVACFTLLGKSIFDLFDITIPAFIVNWRYSDFFSLVLKC